MSPDAFSQMTIVTHRPVQLQRALRLIALGGLMRDAGKLTGAIRVLRKALGLLDSAPGPRYSYIVSTLNQLALCLKVQADLDLSRELLQRALKLSEEYLGSDHALTATTLHNLAVVHKAQGDFSLAAALAGRSVALCEQIMGPQHPDTAAALSNLSLILHAKGCRADAIPPAVRALEVFACNNPQSAQTAFAMNGLAFIYRTNPQTLLIAKSLISRALTICYRELGHFHLDTAMVMANAAYIHSRCGYPLWAMSLLTRALHIYDNKLVPTHPAIADALMLMAELCRCTNRPCLAKSSLIRALHIRRSALGALHPDTVVSQLSIQSLSEL